MGPRSALCTARDRDQYFEPNNAFSRFCSHRMDCGVERVRRGRIVPRKFSPFARNRTSVNAFRWLSASVAPHRCWQRRAPRTASGALFSPFRQAHPPQCVPLSKARSQSTVLGLTANLLLELGKPICSRCPSTVASTSTTPHRSRRCVLSGSGEFSSMRDRWNRVPFGPFMPSRVDRCRAMVFNPRRLLSTMT